MMEQWSRWEPIDGLASKYYIEYILDGSEGLKIVLCEEANDTKKINIEFGLVASYKWTDETFRLSTISVLNEKYGHNFYGEWTFFKIINSPYLKLLSEESDTISDYYEVKHFSFIEDNAIFDVISSSEPKVEMITKE